MKPPSDQTGLLLGSRVVHQQCLACGHAWVDYEGKRRTCLLCNAEKLSPPVSLARIRDVLAEAQKQVIAGSLAAAELADRKSRLTERYNKAAPVFAQRANESYERVSARYLDGELSDRCLDALIFCFHCFAELGLHDAAVRTALLIGSGYFQRVQDKEIQSLADLADLAAARQWFKHLGQDEWVATVDLLTGLKAGHTILERARDKYVLLQISRVHLNRARQYYATKDLPDIQRRVEKESDWINEQLSHAIGAAAAIEAAQINAQSRLASARIVREGLDRVADAVSEGFEELSGSLASGLDLLGQRIDLAGGRVSEAIRCGSQYMGDRILAGASMVSTSFIHHAKETREGARELGAEVRKSIEAAGDKAAGAMSGMGTKMALGMVGGAALHASLLNGTLERLAAGVGPQLQAGFDSLKHLQSPSSTPQPLTTAEFQNLLLERGLGEVNQRIHPYGLELNRSQ